MSNRLHTFSPRPTHSFPLGSRQRPPILPFLKDLFPPFISSFRCVSHQTPLIVFGALGRMCSSYHRARRYATSTPKNLGDPTSSVSGHSVALVCSTSNNSSANAATFPPTALICSSISMTRSFGIPSADRASTSRPAGVNNVFSKKVTAQG